VLTCPQGVKSALLYRAGGTGKKFWVSAGTDAHSEKSYLHRWLLYELDSAGMLLGEFKGNLDLLCYSLEKVAPKKIRTFERRKRDYDPSGVIYHIFT
jgi:hypothetical protein